MRGWMYGFIADIHIVTRRLEKRCGESKTKSARQQAFRPYRGSVPVPRLPSGVNEEVHPREVAKGGLHHVEVELSELGHPAAQEPFTQRIRMSTSTYSTIFAKRNCFQWWCLPFQRNDVKRMLPH